jgi:hypothetical protein
MKVIHKVLAGVIVLIILGGVAGIYLYQKAPNDVSKMDVDLRINADALLSAYEQNEKEATASYTGKVLLVTGTVLSVQLSENNLNVVLTGEGSFYGVNCSFKSDQKSQLESLKQGDTVSIKGLCKGYIDDVILTQCTLERNP